MGDACSTRSGATRTGRSWSNDELVVSGTRIAGEDPRAAQVRAALDAGTPEARAAALRAAGVSVVVVEQLEGYPVAAVAGTTTLDGDLTVVELGVAREVPVSGARRAAMSTAWAAWLLLPTAALAAGWWRRRRGRG